MYQWSHSLSRNEELAESLSEVHCWASNVFILQVHSRVDARKFKMFRDPFRAPLSNLCSPSEAQSVS